MCQLDALVIEWGALREERRVGQKKARQEGGAWAGLPGVWKRARHAGGGRHSSAQFRTVPGPSVHREVKGLRVHVQARDPRDDTVQ